MKKYKENKYFQLGVVLLTVIVITCLLMAVILNFASFKLVVKKVWSAFSPVISGCVMAYLLNPLMNFLDRRLYPFLLKRKVAQKRAFRISRVCSMIFALLFAGVLIYEFCAMLLPQLYESVVGIVNNISSYYESLETWVLGILQDNPDLRDQVNVVMSNAYNYFISWVESDLMSWINTDVIGNINAIFTGLTSSVMSLVGGLLDLLIGVCASIYILSSRDTFLAQAKKLTLALFEDKTANHLLDLGRRVHKVFSGFIIGKIVDSMIIGVLCYIGVLVLKMPFPALIATVIGVTNVIPFFGPFIGAIPCALLILLVDPLKCLYFVIFIFALQQLDGNVIGPRILGDTIGISGFWVLVSITVAGSLFGFAGMLLGVPVFAVLYMLVADFAESRLQKKGRTIETGDYRTIRTVGDLQQEQTPPET